MLIMVEAAYLPVHCSFLVITVHLKFVHKEGFIKFTREILSSSKANGNKIHGSLILLEKA